MLNSGMGGEDAVLEMFDWAASHFLKQPIVGNPTMCHRRSVASKKDAKTYQISMGNDTFIFIKHNQISSI